MKDDTRVALAKGCLGGLGLALAWFVIGGLFYLGARAVGLTQGVGLVIAIVGGPTLVSAVVLGRMIVHAQRMQNSPDAQTEDAAATRDDA